MCFALYFKHCISSGETWFDVQPTVHSKQHTRQNTACTITGGAAQRTWPKVHNARVADRPPRYAVLALTAHTAQHSGSAPGPKSTVRGLLTGGSVKGLPPRYTVHSSPASRKLVSRMVGPAPPEPAVVCRRVCFVSGCGGDWSSFVCGKQTRCRVYAPTTLTSKTNGWLNTSFT